MKHSESIIKLSAALSKAQAEMPSAPMNSVNPFLKNKFADLGAVINASRPVLAKNGLSITQFPVSDNGCIGVTSMLMHESGEWLEETITLPLNEEKGKSAAQVAGSVVTYLRRYSWSSMLGMYADEDTDGHQPEQPKKAQLPSAAKAEAERLWTVAQKNVLIDAQLAKNDFAAKGMLGLSNLPVDASTDMILSWGRAYHERRTAINEATGKPYLAPEAAAYANEKAGKV